MDVGRPAHPLRPPSRDGPFEMSVPTRVRACRVGIAARACDAQAQALVPCTSMLRRSGRGDGGGSGTRGESKERSKPFLLRRSQSDISRSGHVTSKPALRMVTTLKPPGPLSSPCANRTRRADICDRAIGRAGRGRRNARVCTIESEMVRVGKASVRAFCNWRKSPKEPCRVHGSGCPTPTLVDSKSTMKSLTRPGTFSHPHPSAS